VLKRTRTKSKNLEDKLSEIKQKLNLLKLVGAYIRAIREAKIYEHELASELQALNLAHTHLSGYTPKPHRRGGKASI
jgi:hypothetical protein